MEKKCPVVFDFLQCELTQDIGLLILRLGVAGFMLFGHGLGKLLNFSSQYMQFPDPLGVSSPVSLALVVGAEFFCSFAVIVGFATRLACIPLIITMSVAAFVIHADDPWQKKEFALLFLIPFLSICFTGPGRFSLDSFLFRDRQSLQ